MKRSCQTSSRLFGHFKVAGLSAPISLGELQYLFSSLARHHRALNSSHSYTILSYGEPGNFKISGQTRRGSGAAPGLPPQRAVFKEKRCFLSYL